MGSDILSTSGKASQSHTPAYVSAAVSTMPGKSDASTTQFQISSTGDSVALSALASALSGDAASLFNSFTDEDRGKLADLVARGAVTGREVNDGLTGSLKIANKTQIWKLIFKTVTAMPPSQIDAPKAIRDAAQEELDAIFEERGRLFKEMGHLPMQPGSTATTREQRDYMDKLNARSQELGSLLLMDRTKPMTMVGAKGTFFSANAQTETETTALAQLRKMGGMTGSMQSVIDKSASQIAAENIVIRHINS